MRDDPMTRTFYRFKIGKLIRKSTTKESKGQCKSQTKTKNTMEGLSRREIHIPSKAQQQT
jgi:hypothetical protein